MSATAVGRVTAAPAGADTWWRDAVVYQVYPRSFADSDGDGVGDLRGVIDRLDHFVLLGVDVLWLSPFYPSPQVDNGYDVSDHTAVDPLFGSLDDVDELLREAHRRGLRVMIDIVPNHTSDQHAWFRDAVSGPAAAQRDWYIWRPPRPGHRGGEPGAEPNNWRSFFSGPAWTWNAASGEYYLHLFASEQPDLNWDNPAVRTAMADVLRWWIDRGVDGFRFDVLNLLSKTPGLPDGVVPPGDRYGDGYGDGSPYYTCGPRIHEYVAELTAAIREHTPQLLLTVGEMPGVTLDDGLLFTDPARREVDMVFQFDHVELDKGADKFDVLPLDLAALKRVFARWQTGLGAAGWNSQYWSNHDQPRAVSRFGDATGFRTASATLLATVLHLHRGTPFVYQGEELGMVNAPLAGRGDLSDIESIHHYDESVAAGVPVDDVMAGLRAAGRDIARTPMQWTDRPHAGFTAGEPWRPVNPDHQEVNAAAQYADPDSVFHHYRRLIVLRHTDPTISRGDYQLLLPDHPTLYAFTRSLDDDTLLVLANFSGTTLEVPLDPEEWGTMTPVIGNQPRTGDPLGPLAPWEARVLRRTP